MTCRHSPGDPNCSSNRSYTHNEVDAEDAIKRKLESQGWGKLPATPDSENYEIITFQRLGLHLVLKVRYPNCSNCAYEGDKVMVFLNVEEKDAMMWRKIDPHFRDPSQTIDNKQSPSPAARFPASKAGWVDALEYARRKTNQ